MALIHFIINPVAGGGNSLEKLVEAINTAFNRESYTAQLHFSKYQGHAKEIAELLVKKSPSCIVACGGDGTINEVASVIAGSDIKLGIVPIGSGNGLAANLRLPKDISIALQLIKQGNTKKIDAGLINGKYFFSNTGVSFDAEVIKIYEQQKAKGFAGYLKACFFATLSFKPVNAHITFGKHTVEGPQFLLLISNSNQLGYGKSLTPNALPDDGLLDIATVEKIGFWEKIRLGYLLLRGKTLNFEKIKIERITRAAIELPEKIFTTAQIDGEFIYFKTNKFTITVQPACLTVIVP